MEKRKKGGGLAACSYGKPIGLKRGLGSPEKMRRKHQPGTPHSDSKKI